MSKMAYADLFHEWESLLQAVDEHRDKLPEAARCSEDLRAKYLELRRLKAEQESARATYLRTTQLLREVIAAGQVDAMRVRSAAKVGLGPRNERLVRLGVAPVRPRSRRPQLPTERLPGEEGAPAGPGTDKPVH